MIKKEKSVFELYKLHHTASLDLSQVIYERKRVVRSVDFLDFAWLTYRNETWIVHRLVHCFVCFLLLIGSSRCLAMVASVIFDSRVEVRDVWRSLNWFILVVCPLVPDVTENETWELTDHWDDPWYNIQKHL